MTESDKHKTRTLHYASCRYCDLWTWANSEEHAKEEADRHTRLTGHETYTGTRKQDQ